MSESGASELDDDEQHEADDMAELKKKIEAMEPRSEERKMGVREWRRLKRIPAGSVENGVIRSYVSQHTSSARCLIEVFQLEWLTSVPWSNSAGIPNLKDKSFLTMARTQLDADHFGLEKIKKRLIEYLAVVRLKELNAEREALEEQKRTEAIAAASNAEVKAKDVAKQKSTAVVPYDKQQNPSQVKKPASKKSIKGPILLCA